MRRGLRKAVMIVEDDRKRRDYFYGILRLTNVDVISAAKSDEGMQLARTQQPELILLNMYSDATEGISFLKQLRHFGLGQQMVVIGMVGDEDPAKHAAASNAGPDKLLERSPPPHLVLEMVAGFLGIKKIEVPPNMVPTVGRSSVDAVPEEVLEAPDVVPGSDELKPIIRSLSNLLMLTEDAGKRSGTRDTAGDKAPRSSKNLKSSKDTKSSKGGKDSTNSVVLSLPERPKR